MASLDAPTIAALVTIAVTLGGVFGLQKLKEPIRITARRFFHDGPALVERHDALAKELTETKESRDSWRERFDDVDARFTALSSEFESLRNDLDTIRRLREVEQTTMINLTADRDDLVLYARLLVGQLHASGVTPFYQEPHLRTIVVKKADGNELTPPPSSTIPKE